MRKSRPVMLPRLARPAFRVLSLAPIPALILGLALAQLACRPEAGVNDPVNLSWDEQPREGMTKLLKLTRVQGFRVFFWNVAWSSLNAGNVMEHNLTELILSTARPDLIVLAEYKPDAVPPSDKVFFVSEYPHHAFVPYTPGNEVGVAVFSTMPFSQFGPEPLDWAPRGSSDSARATYRSEWKAAAASEVRYWDRAYSRFQWKIAGHKLNLVPLHLLEPWVAYKARYGSYDSLKNLFLGGETPLTHQVHHVREKLERDFGGNADSEPLLMIGDFNVPKHVAPGAPVPIYWTLSGGMSEVFPGNPFTFPAFSSPERQRPPFKYSYVKIDHAFINDHFEPVGAGVLPLRGSDHYPIYIVIKPKK